MEGTLKWINKDLKLRATDGPAKGKHQALTDLLKLNIRAVIWVWGLTHRRAIKEKTIAINQDWVNNQAYRLSHDINLVFHVSTYDFSTLYTTLPHNLIKDIIGLIEITVNREGSPYLVTTETHFVLL